MGVQDEPRPELIVEPAEHDADLGSPFGTLGNAVLKVLGVVFAGCVLVLLVVLTGVACVKLVSLL